MDDTEEIKTLVDGDAIKALLDAGDWNGFSGEDIFGWLEKNKGRFAHVFFTGINSYDTVGFAIDGQPDWDLVRLLMDAATMADDAGVNPARNHKEPVQIDWLGYDQWFTIVWLWWD